MRSMNACGSAWQACAQHTRLPEAWNRRVASPSQPDTAPALTARHCWPPRERNDGLYRVITYLCAKLLDELVLNMLGSILFSIIVFYGVRLQGAWVVFWLVYLLTLSVGIGACPPFSPCISQGGCAPWCGPTNAARPTCRAIQAR